MKIGFDNEKYLKIQSEHIRERISHFEGKLYLEFGGKLFDDYHASRVLPGFEPDSKMKMLLTLKDEAEILIVVSAGDIERHKKRADLEIGYDEDVIRLVEKFRSLGLKVDSAVVTRYIDTPVINQFMERLKKRGIAVYRHYSIEGYPSNIPLIVSDQGYGRNEFVKTTRPLVIVTAPGPGSGRMATCLSQLYHENRRGIRAGYAKFETFPIWNLPLKHPVNLAYEAATADLEDVNMIDPFHLEAYGETAVNYNRDVEIFPVLNAMFERIFGSSPYKSPTDMGVNMAGNCIVDDEVTRKASCEEIIRRYYNTLCECRKNRANEDAVYKIELLMEQAGIRKEDRNVVPAALAKAEETGAPAVAIELNDGTIITGKTSPLLGASSAALLNALKHMAKIDDSIRLLPPSILEPIQDLKVNHLGNHNPRLHTDETLLALSIVASTVPIAEEAMKQLENLKSCEVHSSVILSGVDEGVFRKLGMHLTCEPVYETKKLYHK